MELELAPYRIRSMRSGPRLAAWQLRQDSSGFGNWRDDTPKSRSAGHGVTGGNRAARGAVTFSNVRFVTGQPLIKMEVPLGREMWRGSEEGSADISCPHPH